MEHSNVSTGIRPGFLNPALDSGKPGVTYLPSYSRTLFALILYLFVCAGRIYALFPAINLSKTPYGTIPWGEVTGVFLIIVFFLDIMALGKGKFVFGHADRCVLGLIVLGALGIPFALWGGGAYNTWTTFLKTSLLFFGMSFALQQFNDLIKLFRALAFCFFLTAVAAINKGMSHSTGGVGLMYDPNDVALIMVMGIPVLIYLATASLNVKKIYYYGVAILCIVVIIKSGSRGGFLGLLSLGAYGLYALPAWRMRLLLVGAVGVVLLITMAPSSSMDRFSTIWKPQSDYDRTFGNRTYIWKRGLTTIANHPLFGVGMGNFMTADGNLKGEGAWQTAHNSLLQVGGEMGVPALIVFINLVTGTFLKLRRRQRELSSTTTAAVPPDLLRSLEFSLAGFMVSGLFLSLAYLTYLYVILALAQSALRLSSEHEAVSL